MGKKSISFTVLGIIFGNVLHEMGTSVGKDEFICILKELQFQFAGEKDWEKANIPTGICIKKESDSIEITVTIETKNKSIPEEANSLQVNDFKISFEKFIEGKIILRRRIKYTGFGISLSKSGEFICIYEL